MPKEHAFLVIGPPWSGKTIATSILAHNISAPGGTTDSIVYEELAKERGVPRWSLEASPKEELRPELIRVGNALCDVDPAALVAPLLDRGVRVVDGIRRRVELTAARQAARAAGLVPIVLWLSRYTSIKDNTDVTREDADYVISNNGTIGHLAKMLAEFAAEFQVIPSDAAPFQSFGMPRLDADWEDGLPPSERTDREPDIGDIGD